MSDDVKPKTFDPKKHLRKVSGNDYLDVKWRVLWLRTEQPEATIETELVRVGDGWAIFRAEAALPSGAKGTGYAFRDTSDHKDYLETAETAAIGRALALRGYGTQFCGDDLKESGLTDSPREARSRPHAGGASSNGKRPLERAREGSQGVAHRGTSAPAKRESAVDKPLEREAVSKGDMLKTAGQMFGLTRNQLESLAGDTFGKLLTDLTREETIELINSLGPQPTTPPTGVA